MTQLPQYHDLEVDGSVYRREDGPLAELLRQLRKDRFKDFASLPKLRKLRKPPTLASIVKQARKAGIDPARIEMKPDGSFVIVTGQDEQQQGTEVDKWIAKHADKTQRH